MQTVIEQIREAVDPFFTKKQGTLRVLNVGITDVVKPVVIGTHSQMIIENLGANALFLSANINATPEQWIEALATKSLDFYYDQKIFLSCAAGLTTTIRITVW